MNKTEWLKHLAKMRTIARCPSCGRMPRIFKEKRKKGFVGHDSTVTCCKVSVNSSSYTEKQDPIIMALVEWNRKILKLPHVSGFQKELGEYRAVENYLTEECWIDDDGYLYHNGD